MLSQMAEQDFCAVFGRLRLKSEDVSVLDGLVFRAESPTYATVGFAHGNRLVFEREWSMPAGNSGEPVASVPTLLLESLVLMLEQDLPPARRETVQRASDAVREWVAG
jgi:hypothetical protein